jgi:hypothetical protein
MAKITKLSLKKHLDELDKKELVEEVLKLYTKFSQVKEFYQMELSEDTKAFVESYKKKIKAIYFPARGYRYPKASTIRRLISNFKKVAVFDYDVVDLLLYRVENGIAYSKTFGGIDEAFYTSIESSYDEALKLIVKSNLFGEFKDRCGQIVADSEGIGWGFHDSLSYAYEECFGDE